VGREVPSEIFFFEFPSTYLAHLRGIAPSPFSMLDAHSLLDNLNHRTRPNVVSPFVPVGGVLDPCRVRGFFLCQ
jgi:hypothetical protein